MPSISKATCVTVKRGTQGGLVGHEQLELVPCSLVVKALHNQYLFLYHEGANEEHLHAILETCYGF